MNGYPCYEARFIYRATLANGISRDYRGKIAVVEQFRVDCSCCNPELVYCRRTMLRRYVVPTLEGPDPESDPAP